MIIEDNAEFTSQKYKPSQDREDQRNKPNAGPCEGTHYLTLTWWPPDSIYLGHSQAQ